LMIRPCRRRMFSKRALNARRELCHHRRAGKLLRHPPQHTPDECRLSAASKNLSTDFTDFTD
jgi:hypothetical protein